MATKSSKKRALNDETDSKAQLKRARTATSASASRPKSSQNAAKTDSNGDPYWEISRMRRVTVSTFKGKTMVAVREYYEKDGAELPGKKGISMPLDQVNAFIELLPDIEAVVRQKGETLVRPEYAATPSGLDTSEEDEEEKGEDESESDTDSELENNGKKASLKTRKAGREMPSRKRSNIEATSDEDETE